jgi:hypothetical protein
MGLQFQDDFNRADGAIGNGWTVTLGTVDISSNQARLHTNSAVVKRQVPVATGTDISVALTQGPSWSYAANRTFYVRIRADNGGTNYYQFLVVLGGVGTATVVVSKVISGAATILQQAYQFGVTSGAHIFTFDAQGSTVRFLVDGNLVVTVTDTAIGSGDYLYIGQAGTLDTEYWDDCSIFDYESSAMYIEPSTILPGIAGQNLTLYGLGTSWTAGVPGSPTFTATDGTITYQEIDGVGTAVITYTPPDYPATIMFTDPSTGHVAYLNVVGLPAPVPPGGVQGGLKAFFDALAAAIANLTVPLYTATLDGLTLNVGESIIGYLRTLGTPPTGETFESQLAEVLRQLTVDDIFPDTARHLLAGAITGVVDILADILALTSEGSYSLSDVLGAISALDFSHLTSTDLITAETVIMGSEGQSITDVKQYLDAITADNTHSLSEVLIALDDLATSLQLSTAVTTLRGGDGRDLTAVYNKAEAARAEAALATLAGIAAEGAVAAAVIAIGGLLTAQTAEIDALIAAATAEVNGAIGIAAGELARDIAGVAGTLSTVSAGVTTANGKLDDILALLGTPVSGPPLWPGVGHVTTGTPTAVSGDMRVVATMEGCLLELTTIPQRNVYWTADGLTNVERAGFLVFCADNGYADERQPIAWSHGVYCPKRLLTATSVVVHLTGLASGTLTPWIRS